MGLQISDILCRHVADMAVGDLPASTMHAAKRVLLDASGVMIAAAGAAPEVAPFIALAKAGGGGPCSVLGTTVRATPAMAALANGSMAHALDYEDAFDDVPGHPNASLVPALIALAQSEGPIDGRSFLAALAIGSDISCRIGLGLPKPVDALGWYAPPVIASIGAAAGAARLLGLDSKGVRDAISLTLCQSTMPGEIRFSRGTVIRAVREGFPAQAAVLSALLAREGTAGFEEPLEGKGGFYALFAGGEAKGDALLDGLGADFWIERLTFKPWPSCRATHSFIEMALTLREEHGFDAEDIAKVEIIHDRFQAMLIEPLDRKRAPDVPIDAKFSIPWCTALALVRGGVGLDDFAPSVLKDPAILAVSAKTTHRLLADAKWSTGAGGMLEITLNDGRVLSAGQDNALGYPGRMLPDGQLTDKFVECAGRGQEPLDPGNAKAFAEAIWSLEDCPDVGALFAAH